MSSVCHFLVESKPLQCTSDLLEFVVLCPGALHADVRGGSLCRLSPFLPCRIAAIALAPADGQQDGDCLHLWRRLVVSRSRGRRRAPLDLRSRHQHRREVFSGWIDARFHWPLLGQRRRICDARNRGPTTAFDLSPGGGRSHGLDSGRQERCVSLHAPQLLSLQQQTVYRVGDRRPGHRTPAAHRGTRRVLARRYPPCLCSSRTVAARLAALSRRTNHSHLDRRSQGFLSSEDPARKLQRLQPDVGWEHDLLSFRPQRSRELVRLRPRDEAMREAVKNDGFDFKSASAGSDAIVIEQFGALKLYDLNSGQVKNISVRVSGDLPELRPQFVKIEPGRLRNLSLSPAGVRVVAEAWGEIFTIPSDKGDIRNLTQSPAVADRDPAWSPDGKWICYFSEEPGEYELQVREQNGMGAVKHISLGNPPSYFYNPVWSPDNRKIAYTDKRLNIWIADVANGKLTKAD